MQLAEGKGQTLVHIREATGPVSQDTISRSIPEEFTSKLSSTGFPSSALVSHPNMVQNILCVCVYMWLCVLVRATGLVPGSSYVPSLFKEMDINSILQTRDTSQT